MQLYTYKNIMNVHFAQKKLLIDGKPVAARTGRTFETIDPATEEVMRTEDTDIAVAARRAARLTSAPNAGHTE